MDRGKAIEGLKALLDCNYIGSLSGEDIEILEIAIDTMRKYQQIQEIVKEWREVGLDYDSCDAMDNIERVIEDGNDK